MDPEGRARHAMDGVRWYMWLALKMRQRNLGLGVAVSFDVWSLGTLQYC